MKKITALILILSICLPLFNKALISTVQANGEYVQHKYLEQHKYLKEPLPRAIDHSIRGCDIKHGPVLKFIAGNLDNLLIFIGANVITSFLADLPFVGGIFEPSDQIADFVLHKWLSALLWGGTATIGLYLGVWLLEAGISLNHQIISPQNLVIEIGFPIMLGFAYIMFVVILIIMAFLTILRVAESEKCNITATLPRLIVAILLINFSLLFAGAILKISDNLIQDFLGEGRCPGVVFYNEFNIFKLDGVVGKALWESTGRGMMGYFLTLFSLIFAVFLTIIIALTVFVLFLFFIMRYIAITILLVFMPVAWIGFVIPSVSIPGIGNLWKSWWQEFLKWVIFGPLIAFFLYLSLIFITGFQQINNQFPGGFGMILQLIIVVIISLGGLFAANKMGAAGSSLILAGANAGLGFMTARTQTLGQLIGRGFLYGETKLGKSPSRVSKRTAQVLGDIGRRIQMPQVFPTTKGITDEIQKLTGIKLPTPSQPQITARITPRKIPAGGTAVLTWQSSGATNVTLTINPDPNLPSSRRPLTVRVALSGHHDIVPTVSNTYTCTLTATNPFGRATARVFLLVI